MTFSMQVMQLHILRWYVTAAGTSTYMGTAHTDRTCCIFAGHMTLKFLFKQALPKFMTT